MGRAGAGVTTGGVRRFGPARLPCRSMWRKEHAELIHSDAIRTRLLSLLSLGPDVPQVVPVHVAFLAVESAPALLRRVGVPRTIARLNCYQTVHDRGTASHGTVGRVRVWPSHRSARPFRPRVLTCRAGAAPPVRPLDWPIGSLLLHTSSQHVPVVVRVVRSPLLRAGPDVGRLPMMPV
jgi:hypothetical protein